LCVDVRRHDPLSVTPLDEALLVNHEPIVRLPGIGRRWRRGLWSLGFLRLHPRHGIAAVDHTEGLSHHLEPGDLAIYGPFLSRRRELGNEGSDEGISFRASHI